MARKISNLSGIERNVARLPNRWKSHRLCCDTPSYCRLLGEVSFPRMPAPVIGAMTRAALSAGVRHPPIPDVAARLRARRLLRNRAAAPRSAANRPIPGPSVRRLPRAASQLRSRWNAGFFLACFAGCVRATFHRIRRAILQRLTISNSRARRNHRLRRRYGWPSCTVRPLRSQRLTRLPASINPTITAARFYLFG